MSIVESGNSKAFYPDESLDVFNLVTDHVSENEEIDIIHKQSDSTRQSRDLVVTISDEKLEKMTIKALNSFVRGLSLEKVVAIRRRRRILKNRKYALKCRQKTTERSVDVANENKTLEAEIKRAKEELRKVEKERDRYKAKYKQLTDTFSSLRSAAMASKI